MLELKRRLEMRVLIYDQEICEGDVNLLRAAMQLININKARLVNLKIKKKSRKWLLDIQMKLKLLDN